VTAARAILSCGLRGPDITSVHNPARRAKGVLERVHLKIRGDVDDCTNPGEFFDSLEGCAGVCACHSKLR